MINMTAAKYAQISDTEFKGKTTPQVKAESSGSLDAVRQYKREDHRAREIRDEFNLMKATFLQHSQGPADEMPSENHVGLSNASLELTVQRTPAPGLFSKLAAYFSGPKVDTYVGEPVSGEATLRDVDGEKEISHFSFRSSKDDGLYGFISKAASNWIIKEKGLARDDEDREVYIVRESRVPFDKEKNTWSTTELVRPNQDGSLDYVKESFWQKRSDFKYLKEVVAETATEKVS